MGTIGDRSASPLVPPEGTAPPGKATKVEEPRPKPAFSFESQFHFPFYAMRKKITDGVAVSKDELDATFKDLRQMIMRDPAVLKKLQNDCPILMEEWEKDEPRSWDEMVKEIDDQIKKIDYQFKDKEAANLERRKLEDRLVKLDNERTKCVKILITMMDKIDERDGVVLPVATSDQAYDPTKSAEATGTQGARSDCDVTCTPIVERDGSKSYAKNVRLGVKAAQGAIIGRALCRGDVLTRLDVSLYQPSFAEIHNPTLDPIDEKSAKAIQTTASLVSLFLQAKRTMVDDSESMDYLKDQIVKEFNKLGLEELVPGILTILKEVEEMIEEVQKFGDKLPEEYRDLRDVFFNDRLSRLMEEVGSKIDSMKPGSRQKEIAQLQLLFGILAYFPTENYTTGGACAHVILDKEGGQKMVAREKDPRPITEAELASKGIRQVSHYELVESAIENSICACPKEDLYNFAKYGLRATSALLRVLPVMRQKIEGDESLTSERRTKALETIKKLTEDFEKLHQAMYELERVKRRKLGKEAQKIVIAQKVEKGDSQIQAVQAAFEQVSQRLESRKNQILLQGEKSFDDVFTAFMKEAADLHINEQAFRDEVLQKIKHKYPKIEEEALSPVSKNVLWEALNEGLERHVRSKQQRRSSAIAQEVHDCVEGWTPAFRQTQSVGSEERAEPVTLRKTAKRVVAQLSVVRRMEKLRDAAFEADTRIQQDKANEKITEMCERREISLGNRMEAEEELLKQLKREFLKMGATLFALSLLDKTMERPKGFQVVTQDPLPSPGAVLSSAVSLRRYE